MKTTEYPTQNEDIAILARGAGVSFLGKFVGRGIQAVSQIALARILGTELYGLYTLGWIAARVGGVIVPLGLDKGVIHFASVFGGRDYAYLKSVFYKTISIAMVFGLLVGGFLFAAAPWLEVTFAKPGLTAVFRGFSYAFPILASLKVATAATRVSKRMKYAVYIEDIIQPSVNFLLILFLIWVGGELVDFILVNVVSFIIAFAVSLYYLYHLYTPAWSAPLDANPSAKTLLAFSIPTTFAGAFIVLTNWGSPLFIGYFHSSTEVGIYQAVSQVTLWFTVILTAFNAVFSPLIADLYHKGEMIRLQELFKVSTKWGLYLSLPIFLLICAVPDKVLIFLFRLDYVAGVAPLLILASTQLLNVATGSVGFILIMTGRQKQWLTISGIMLLTNLILNLLLVPRFSLIGAATATAGTIGCLFLVGLVQVKRTVGLWPYDYRYVKGLWAMLVTAVVLFLLNFVSIPSLTMDLLLNGFLSVGVFGMMLLLLGLDKEDREFINLVWLKLNALARH